jgi:cytochrome c oxidase subunit III
MEILTVNSKDTLKFNPQLFGLWIGMASIVMLFGALTSAYIVKQGASNWFDIKVPSIFYISTGIIIVSSITLHFARMSYTKSLESIYKILLGATFILGLVFFVLQYKGWNMLFESGVDLKSNVAGSFFYLITGAHALHLFGGMGALVATIINAFVLRFRNDDNRKTRLEMLVHYWHFMGILWIYLLGFILFIK